MENTFLLELNGAEYEIRVSETHQFEVFKKGTSESFTIQHKINDEGNEVFELLQSDKHSSITPELINTIGDKIDSHYL